MTRYPFTCTIKCPETGVTLFPDFECEVEVYATISDEQVVTNCRDVLVDGVSLDGKSSLSQLIRYQVMELADEQLEHGGSLWDAIISETGFQWVAGPETDGRWVA